MSAVEKPELIRIAEAIPDGTPVDWEARSSAPPADELVLTQLRDLERVAAAHREVGSAPAAEDASSAFPEAGAGAAAAGAAEPSLATWGRLRILERIGGGTFAEVFRAYDPSLQHEVALKLLFPDPLAEERHL